MPRPGRRGLVVEVFNGRPHFRCPDTSSGSMPSTSLASPAGLEPATLGSEDQRSNSIELQGGNGVYGGIRTRVLLSHIQVRWAATLHTHRNEVSEGGSNLEN